VISSSSIGWTNIDEPIQFSVSNVVHVLAGTSEMDLCDRKTEPCNYAS